MSGGTQTSTSSSQPPQQFLDAYNALMGQAAGVANQPLQQYSGPIVAGLSPDQQSAISTIQGAQGIGNDYYNAAADSYGQAGTPLSTNAPQIAQAAGSQANGIAAGAGATAQGAAGQGVGIAQSGAVNNAARANNAAGTNVWGQVGPVTAGQIQNYEDPYTNDVVNSTQAEFNNQNAQAQQGGISQAIKGGAWGGDRAGVAAGILAGQQQLAQAPVIAGLQNQGYSQALGEANTQQALQAGLGQNRANLMASTALGSGNLLSNTGIASGQLGANTALSAGQLGTNTALGAGNLGIAGAGQQLQADEASQALALQSGQGFAGLGNEVQNNTLAGANAQLGVGNLEQQINQSQLNVPYQQFQQQQQYPFQTTQWLTSLIQGLGSSAGGNSSTTSPGPSGTSQAIGGIGALASLASLFAARGGAIKSLPKRASGGIAPPDLSLSYIPDYKAGTSGMGGPPKPPKPEKEQADDLSGIGGMVGSIGKLKSKLGQKTGIGGLPDDSDFTNSFSDQFSGLGSGGDFDPASAAGDFGSMGTDASMLASAGWARGGGIDHFASGGTNTGHDSNSHIDGNMQGSWLKRSTTNSRGILVPHLESPTGWSNEAANLPKNLTEDYGNAAADSSGKSTLPSSTYYPNVDPWFSANPANSTTTPASTTGGITTPAKTTLNPGVVNPTISTIGGPGGFDLSKFLSGSGLDLSGMPGLKSGGGIDGYAEGGAPDDDDDERLPSGIGPEDMDDDSAPAAPPGMASSITGGPAFSTHPIDKQPAGSALPPPPDHDTGIAYKPRKATAVEDQPESKDAGKLGLLAASLGIMAGTSPHALQNIGAGGLEGLKTYEKLKGTAADRAEKQAEEEDTGSYHAATLDQAAKRFGDTIAVTRQKVKQLGDYQTGELGIRQQQADQQGSHNAAMERLQGADFEYLGPSKEDPTKGVYMNKKTGQTQTGVVAAPKTGAGSDPEYVQDRINKIGNYQEKPMSAFERKTDDGKAIEKGLHDQFPDYSETYFPAAVTARTKFASGKQGDTVKSFNVSLSHLATLDSLRDALDNGNIKLYNSIKNKLSEDFGGTAITDYDTAHRIVMDEATKAVIGSAGGQQDREGYAKTAAAAQSNLQGHNASNIMRGLMVGQLKGLQTQYKFGTRANDFEDMLDDEAKGLLHNTKFQPGVNPNAKNTGAAAPTNAAGKPLMPQNGWWYDPDTHQAVRKQ